MVPVVGIVSGCVSPVVVPVAASGVVSIAAVAVTSVGMLSAVLGGTTVPSVEGA